MKKTLIITALLAAYASPLVANEPSFTMSGTMGPAACSLTITNKAVKLGHIKLQDLGETTAVALDSFEGYSWSEADAPLVKIVCTGDAPIAFSLKDNQESTLDVDALTTKVVPGQLGIGRFTVPAETEANSIGYMEIVPELVTATSVAGAITAVGDLQRSDNDGAWAVQSTPALHAGTTVRYRYSGLADGANSLDLRLLGKLTLQPKSKIHEDSLAATHNINGNFTVAVHF